MKPFHANASQLHWDEVTTAEARANMRATLRNARRHATPSNGSIWSRMVRWLNEEAF